MASSCRVTGGRSWSVFWGLEFAWEERWRRVGGVAVGARTRPDVSLEPRSRGPASGFGPFMWRLRGMARRSRLFARRLWFPASEIMAQINSSLRRKEGGRRPAAALVRVAEGAGAGRRPHQSGQRAPALPSRGPGCSRNAIGAPVGSSSSWLIRAWPRQHLSPGEPDCRTCLPGLGFLAVTGMRTVGEDRSPPTPEPW